MTWQGVPFFFTQEKLNESIQITLSSLPKIVIDSPPDYTNVVITAGVSFLAGLIPALIAVWTFKRNAENTKSERERQQEFLSEERNKHQDFLNLDREKQQRSFEEDRKTQIIIAKNNFDMQVLSGNRQSWINTLRELIAEYTVEAAGKVTAYHTYKLNVIYIKEYHQNINERSPFLQDPEFQTRYKEARGELESAKLLKNHREDRVSLLESKILLMINPKESEYEIIKNYFITLKSFADEIINSSESYEESSKLYASNINLTRNIVNEMLSVMQKVLKREWERVKMGI